MSKSRTSFSIAALLILTTVIAVHCAFPILFVSLFYTLLYGVLLLMLMFPILAIAALSSPSVKGQLDVARNRAFKAFVWLYLLLLVLIYSFLVYSVGIGATRYY